MKGCGPGAAAVTGGGWLAGGGAPWRQFVVALLNRSRRMRPLSQGAARPFMQCVAGQPGQRRWWHGRITANLCPARFKRCAHAHLTSWMAFSAGLFQRAGRAGG